MCGGIEMAVSAMKKHISNPGVCEKVCAALNNISFNNGKQRSSNRAILNERFHIIYRD